MSRSHKKTPVFGYGSKRSIKSDKRLANQRIRAMERKLIAEEKWDDLTAQHWFGKNYKDWEWKEGQHYNSPYDKEWCYCRNYWSYRIKELRFLECYIHSRYGSYEKYIKRGMRK